MGLLFCVGCVKSAVELEPPAFISTVLASSNMKCAVASLGWFGTVGITPDFLPLYLCEATRSIALTSQHNSSRHTCRQIAVACCGCIKLNLKHTHLATFMLPGVLLRDNVIMSGTLKRASYGAGLSSSRSLAAILSRTPPPPPAPLMLEPSESLLLPLLPLSLPGP